MVNITIFNVNNIYNRWKDMSTFGYIAFSFMLLCSVVIFLISGLDFIDSRRLRKEIELKIKELKIKEIELKRLPKNKKKNEK